METDKLVLYSLWKCKDSYNQAKMKKEDKAKNVTLENF